MKLLNEMQSGQTATVVGYNDENRHCKRLKSLGLVPGTVITVQRLAPLGDPLQVVFRGYSLGLRRTEAGCITVRPHAT